MTLASRGNLSKHEADEKFTDLALKLSCAQYAANPAYKLFCDAKGIRPDSLQDWHEIPAVPTTAFKELDLTSLPTTLRRSVFHSSGTTEQRSSRHFHSEESLVLYEKSLLTHFRSLFAHRDPFLALAATNPFAILSLTPSPAAAPNSSLVHMFASVRGDFGTRQSTFTGYVDEVGWQVDLPKTQAWLEVAVGSESPVLVVGTAFSYVHLCDALDGPFNLPHGSVVLETGGYKGRSRELLREELHQLIVEKLGVERTNIVCEYGMSELSSQAYAFADAATAARIFRFPAWAKTLVVSPETGREVAEGQTGLLRIMDLANVYSVMAIQTEDLAVRRGPGFELLGRAPASEPRGCSLRSV